MVFYHPSILSDLSTAYFQSQTLWGLVFQVWVPKDMGVQCDGWGVEWGLIRFSVLVISLLFVVGYTGGLASVSQPFLRWSSL